MPINFVEIKRRREAAGLTMEQAAARANEVFRQIGETTVWNRGRWNDVESSRRRDTRVSTLQVVALVLSCREQDLITSYVDVELPRVQKRNRSSGDAGSNA